MKKRKLLFSVLALVLTGTVFSATPFSKGKVGKYKPRKIESRSYEQGITGAVEYMHLLRADRRTNKVNQGLVLNAINHTELLKKTKSGGLNLKWVERGPDNIGGRTRAILITKNNPNLMFAGGVAGGLWKSESAGSSWVKVDYLSDYEFGGDKFSNLAISCITESANGDIYFGTGEGIAFNNSQGQANGGTSFLGYGVWKSTDGGKTFNHLTSTKPTEVNSENIEWAYVSRLAVDPDSNNRIYAATNRGLRMSNDGGVTWKNPVYVNESVNVVYKSQDVKVASDGSVFAVIGEGLYYSPNGNIKTFTKINKGGFPTSEISRIEIAIAPSDPNYVYACIAKKDGSLMGIYRSVDKGVNWDTIGKGGSAGFQVFGPNNQGWYDNVIAVYPNNKNKIIVGGVDMWTWDAETDYWELKTQWFLNNPGQFVSPYYIHADHHTYVFHPNNPNIIYAGSDGGISKSVDGGTKWITMNKNYNVTQFYTLTAGYYGEVMGGTQDNGTLLIDGSLNTKLQARYVYGGDGAGCALSMLNPNVMFASSPKGAFGRSYDNGKTFSSPDDGTFKDTSIMKVTEAAFVAPVLLWESYNDTSSIDSVLFTNTGAKTLNIGEKVSVYGYNNYPFEYQLTDSLQKGESVKVKDVVTARFYSGLNGSVWMTKGALDFSKTPAWFKIANIEGKAQFMACSKDGNHLFVGTEYGKIYRISNLLYANDYESANIDNQKTKLEVKLINDFAYRAVTSISVYPDDANNIVVTLGNYGNDDYVYYSNNALSANPTLKSVQGNLPKMPVYASCMLMGQNGKTIIGTEFGVFSTDDVKANTVSWSFDSEVVGNVPVYAITQQTNYRPAFVNKEGDKIPGSTNYGAIYIATHGRGMFESVDYLNVKDNNHTISVVDNNTPEIKILGNPVSDNAKIEYTLFENANVILEVYSVNGNLVERKDLGYKTSGIYNTIINCVNYNNGSYIVNLKADNLNKSVKLSVVK